jgi:hypothetical protein
MPSDGWRPTDYPVREWRPNHPNRPHSSYGNIYTQFQRGGQWYEGLANGRPNRYPEDQRVYYGMSGVGRARDLDLPGEGRGRGDGGRGRGDGGQGRGDGGQGRGEGRGHGGGGYVSPMDFLRRR